MKLNAEKVQFREIAAIIRKDIECGKLKSGERLESIRKLAADFKVGRQVVVSAFGLLAEENLLVTHPGRGTFVGSNFSPVIRLAYYSHLSPIGQYFNREIFFGCAEEAESCGAEILVANNLTAKTLPDWCQKENVNGLILSGFVNQSMVDELNVAKINYIVVGDYDLRCVKLHYRASHQTMFDAIIQALEAYGIRRIWAFLANAGTFATNNIIAGLKSCPAVFEEDKIFYPEHENGFYGMTELEKFLPLSEKTLLLVTGRALPGTAKYIYLHGKPENLYLASVSDYDFNDIIDVKIKSGNVRSGRLAAAQLLEAINQNMEMVK